LVLDTAFVVDGFVPSPQLVVPLILSPVCAAHVSVAVTAFPTPTFVGVTANEHATAEAATTVSVAVLLNTPATLGVNVVSVAVGVMA
jgi:hypothetical protein